MNLFDFVRPSTIALWTFDNEDGVDSGPNGYDLVEGELDYALGRFGPHCGYFDGNNYLRSTANFSQLGLTQLTAAFWMKSNYAAEQYIFGNVYTGYGNTYGYNFGTTSSKQLFFETYPGDGYDYRLAGGSVVIDNTWKWIVITRGSSLTKFYINGKLDYTAGNTALGFNGSEITCVGAWWYIYYSTANDYYVGYLDNLHILNVELSHATIRRMYAFQMGQL